MEERKKKREEEEEEEEGEEEEEKKKTPFINLPSDMILYEILIHVEILFKVPISEISEKMKMSVIKKTNFYFARDKHHENRNIYRFNNIRINGYTMTKIEFKRILRDISPKIKILSLHDCPFIPNFLHKFALYKMYRITINEINTDVPYAIVVFKKELFKKVKRIHLEDIRMNKLTGFKGATQLESIVLKSSDFTPIIPMIYDISGLKDCYNLKKIELNGLLINLFPYFKNFNKITVIKIVDCSSLINISQLGKLTNLRELVIYRCRKIVSYDSISKLFNLVNLRLLKCYLSNITFLKYLKKLQYLNLESNNLTDITPLKELTLLSTLILSSNNIKDITPLKYLKKLQYLNLESNNLTDITPLKELTLLSTLILSYNDIKDISSLVKLINMKKLQLNKNKISKFKVGIKHMTKLQIIDMKNNTTTESMEFLLDKLVFKELRKVDFPRILTQKWVYSEEFEKFHQKWIYSKIINNEIQRKFYITHFEF